MQDTYTLTLAEAVALARSCSFREILRVPMPPTAGGEWPSLTFMFDERRGLLLQLETTATTAFSSALLFGNHRPPSGVSECNIVFPLRLQLCPRDYAGTLTEYLPSLEGQTTFVTPWSVFPRMTLAHNSEIEAHALAARFDEPSRLYRVRMFPAPARRVITPCLPDKEKTSPNA